MFCIVSFQTLFVLNNYTACRDESVFKDALKFQPERWDRNGQYDIHPFAALPFGFGTRSCIGIYCLGPIPSWTGAPWPEITLFKPNIRRNNIIMIIYLRSINYMRVFICEWVSVNILHNSMGQHCFLKISLCFLYF